MICLSGTLAFAKSATGNDTAQGLTITGLGGILSVLSH